MPLSTVICAMFRRYLNSFKKKGSRYIAWNILFLLGFGLWIALCISNMHHVDDSTKEEEAMEEMLHVTTVNYALHNLIVIVRTVLQYVQVFVSMSFMILFACSNEYVRKITRAWNNVVSNFCAVVSRFTMRTHNKNVDKNGCTISESKHNGNSEINAECVETEFRYENKNEWTLEQTKCVKKSDANINTVQSEIIFSSYTLLLFNNYDHHQCFRSPLLKNRLSNKYLVDQRLDHTRRSLKVTNNFKKHDVIYKKIMRRGIVSSSPEFQKFLANLKSSQLVYPCTLEVSTDYVVRIKSIYK